MVWSPDGSKLATVDPLIYVWELDTRQVSLIDDNYLGRRTVFWLEDSVHFIAEHHLDMVRLWDSSTGQEKAYLDEFKGALDTFYLSPDGASIAMSMTSGYTLVRQAHNGQLAFEILGSNAKWPPDGKRIATISQNRLVLYDAKDGAEIGTLAGHTAAIRDMSWSPDSKRLITVAEDFTALIWDVETGETVLALGETEHGRRGSFDYIGLITWSPDGSRVASTKLNSAVDIWDATSGLYERALVYDRGDSLGIIHSPVWHPDGQWIAALTHYYSENCPCIDVWDVHTGEREKRLPIDSVFLGEFQWSRDGHFIFYLLEAKMMAWDIVADEAFSVFGDLPNGIGAFAQSTDASRLITAHQWQIMVWEQAVGHSN